MWVGLKPTQKQKQGSRGQGVPNNLLFWLHHPGLRNLPTAVSSLPCLPQEQLSPRHQDVCTGNYELEGGGVGMLGARGCWGVPLFLSSLATEFPRQK